MSLSGAVSSALSGLLSNQEQMRVISGNVSNAGVEGFTRKTAPQSTRVVGNSTNAGVQNAEVQRNVDDFLIERVRRAETDLAFDETKSEFFQRVQDFFGSPSSDTNLSNKINSLRQDIEALAIEPENSAAQSSTVQEATNVARDMRAFSQETQNLRAQADLEIDVAVEELNGNLKEIRDLNAQISQVKAAGESSAELEDRRDRALKEVSQVIDIETFQRPTGEIAVLSGDSNARPLVDGFADQLTFGSAGSLGAGESAGAVRFTDGTEVDAENIGGRLGALLQVRDQDLPNFQADLDRLAAQLREQVNEAHNTGMLNNEIASAGNGLTGTHAFDDSAQTIAGASGTLEIVAVQPDGTVATDGSGNPRVISVDLGSISPSTSAEKQLENGTNGFLDQVNDEIDTDPSSGTPGTSVGFDVGSDGKVTLTNPFGDAPNSNGNDFDFTIRTNGARIESNQINAQNTNPSATDTTPDRNFSHFFGFNNFFETPDLQQGFDPTNPDMITGNMALPGGTNAPADTGAGVSAAGTLRVREDIVADPSKMSRIEAKTGAGETALPNGDPLVAQRMAQRFDNVVDFRNPGDLRTVVTQTSQNGVADPTQSIESQFGSISAGSANFTINNGTPPADTISVDTANDTLNTVASKIQATGKANARVVERDGESFLEIRPQQNGQSLTISDVSGNENLVSALNLQQQTVEGNQTTGNVGGRRVTLANFAGDILQFQAQETERLNTSVDAQNGVKDQLQLRIDNQSGVNIDEELANMIQFQQAFQANARVISVVDEMFTTLDQMAR